MKFLTENKCTVKVILGFDIQCNISLDRVNVCMCMLVSPK